MPVSQYKSLFCLEGYNASPFDGISSLLTNTAMDEGCISFTKRWRFCLNIRGFNGKYFILKSWLDGQNQQFLASKLTG
jgi:hypothetical protein